ncbi:MAG: ribonuclease HI [Armatimonadetes bacterium]|nr:ribonuclease HI [Armatimonadota bacterium]
MVTIYTDGACIGNPGPGGFAAIVIGPDGAQEIASGYRLTTNNRMEMLAAIEGLRSLKAPSRVKLHSDSQYLVNGMRLGWARKWRRNGWMRNAKEPALNPDLWDEMLRLSDIHAVEWVWVRGHAGDPMNERCDRLSVEHAKRFAEKVDEVYEAHKATSSRA